MSPGFLAPEREPYHPRPPVGTLAMSGGSGRVAALLLHHPAGLRVHVALVRAAELRTEMGSILAKEHCADFHVRQTCPHALMLGLKQSI